LQRRAFDGRTDFGHADVDRRQAGGHAARSGRDTFIAQKLDDRRSLDQRDGVVGAVLHTVQRIVDHRDPCTAAAGAGHDRPRRHRIGVVDHGGRRRRAVVKDDRVQAQVFAAGGDDLDGLVGVACRGRVGVVVVDLVDEDIGCSRKSG
jgi:hypothetical protein